MRVRFPLTALCFSFNSSASSSLSLFVHCKSIFSWNSAQYVEAERNKYFKRKKGRNYIFPTTLDNFWGNCNCPERDFNPRAPDQKLSSVEFPVTFFQFLLNLDCESTIFDPPGGDMLLAQGIYLTDSLPLSACESHVDPALSHRKLAH